MCLVRQFDIIGCHFRSMGLKTSTPMKFSGGDPDRGSGGGAEAVFGFPPEAHAELPESCACGRLRIHPLLILDGS